MNFRSSRIRYDSCGYLLQNIDYRLSRLLSSAPSNFDLTIKESLLTKIKRPNVNKIESIHVFHLFCIYTWKGSK